MPAVLEHDTTLSLEHGVALEHTPARITTTLYDLLAGLQDVAPADDDTQVVATVVHWMRTGRLTWVHALTAVPTPEKR
jgi:hypothetical protein